MSQTASVTPLQPHAPESEAAILGACLYDPCAWERVVASLSVEDFWTERCRVVFSAMGKIRAAGFIIDELALVANLRESGQVEAVGGAGLAWLTEWAFTSHDIEQRIREVRDRSMLRRALSTVRDWSNRARGDVDNAGQFTDDLARDLMQIASVRQTHDPRILREVLSTTMTAIEQNAKKGPGLSGVPTGFRVLDDITDGWQKTDVVIIAARPRMGKTAFTVGEAVTAAQAGFPSLVFSLEMSADQLARRILAFQSGVDLNAFRRAGALNDQLLDRADEAVYQLRGLPLWIDEQASQTPESMLAKARRIKREHGLGLIVVDYVQLMRGRSRGSDNREREVAEISRSLKLMAKDLDVPVLACCQLSRKLEERMVKVPMLSDLRESGALEQDADLVVFLHRPEVFDVGGVPRPELQGVAEIHVAKHRNGEPGVATVRFEGAKTRFVDGV